MPEYYGFHTFLCLFFWFGQSKFRVTLTLSSPWGLHHLHVILFSSMASWLTFARTLGLGLSWSPFLDSVVISQLPAGAGPATSASMPRFVQPKDIGQFGSSYGQQSVNSFSPLCLYVSGEFFFPILNLGINFFKLFFNLSFLYVEWGKTILLSSPSWLNPSTLPLLLWYRLSWETREWIQKQVLTGAFCLFALPCWKFLVIKTIKTKSEEFFFIQSR